MGIKDRIWKFKYKKLSLLSLYCYNNKVIELPYPPLEVFIESTNHCNLRCIICPHSAGLKREKGFMSWDIFRKIITEVVEAKALKVTLNFAGEPLLNNNLLKMIHLSKANNLYVRIHTNGTELTQDYAEALINSGLDELSFSFDSSHKEAYEKIRVNASFEKTLSNIKMFLETKKRLKKQKPYTIIQRIKLSTDSYNQGDDDDYRKLFAGLPVDKFYTIPTHNWAGSCQDPFIKKYGGGSAKLACRVIWSRFAIGWDGKAYACCNDMNGKLLIGDINNTSLLGIWNGPQMLELRNLMLASRYQEVEACRDCDVLLRIKKSDMGIIKAGLAKLFLQRA